MFLPDICVLSVRSCWKLSKTHHQSASGISSQFPGAHSIQDDAYEAKEISGVTVHFVDEGVDTAKSSTQEKITIDSTWSKPWKSMHLEYDMFPKVIKHVCK